MLYNGGMPRRHRGAKFLVVSAALCAVLASASLAHATSELVAHFKFDESSGGAADSSGNLSTLTNNNGVTYGDGQYGNAAYFNGTNQYFSGTGPVLDGQSFTFSAWLWRDSDATGERIYFSQGSFNGQHRNLHLRVYENGQMRFGFLSNDVDAPSGTFAMNQWNHVVLTYDADTNERKIYLNGGAAKASDTSVSDFTGNTDLNIGRWIFDSQYWKGRIDDLKIYNRALTQDEVTDIAEGGAGPGLLGVDSFSPADNATGVALTANLVATFSTTTVATSTGSIGIYKTSDNSLVESIAVSSSQITKSGADITINPSVTLANSTEYYVWIPSTAFKDANDVFYEGITASTTWSFTTIPDNTAPTISNVATSSVSSSGITVTWDTDEAASTKVVYSVDTNYASSTVEADTGTRVTSHSQALSSLLACTIYSFRVVSRDAAGNAATSTAGMFTTTGCSGGASPTSATTTTITVSSAASTTITDSGRTITVETPEDFTATSSSIVIQIKGLSADTVLGSIGRPSGLSSGASIVFDVKALIDNITELDSFDVPVTISYTYTDDDVSGLDESTLSMYHYASGAWSELDDCSVNTATNTITCEAPHFSIFAIFGSAPSSNSSQSGGGVMPWCSGPNAPGWDSSMPDGGCGTTTEARGEKSTCPAYTFARTLRFGMTGEDVRALQRLMNCLGFTLAASGPGAPGEETNLFVSRTHAALVRFQEAHAYHILAPLNLAKGTGIFAEYSRRTALALTNGQ